MVKKLKYNRFKLSKLEKTILEIEQDKIDRYISKKEENMIILNYENYQAGLVFCEKYKSEMGNRLSINHPELDFIIMINLSGGISFRTDKDIDLSLIAQKLNGGGHKKACGAPIPEELKREFINKLFRGCEIIENQENNNR
jgi:nanoRNase/pAp phosphatase (c-di-AMP/oligoRNAs hydrolase)